MFRARGSSLRLRRTSRKLIISCALSLTRARIFSGARCYSYTLTATAITACVVTICAANLTYPFGRYKKPYFPEAELYHFAEKAQNAFFYCESYAESMARADANSVVYCDPPYAPLSATANFTAYHTNSFTLEQQAHLAAIAESLVNNRIPVLISNHDTALTREWYSQAKLHVVKVRRSISSNGGTRKKVDELLALYRPATV